MCCKLTDFFSKTYFKIYKCYKHDFMVGWVLALVCDHVVHAHA